jgi:integrase/recombinase XerD
MGNLVLDSVYYAKWYRLARLKETSKSTMKYSLKEFGNYIRDYGYNGTELNFDKFYYSEEDDGYEPIDLDFVESYVEYLKEHKTEASLHSHFSAVKSFFNFLESMELIEENPFGRYPTSFHYSVLKNRALSPEESDRLLKAAAVLDPFFLQYAVLILTCLTCGLRSRELCNLRLSQINFELGTIIINRGQKTFAGSVHMTDALIKYLKAYVEHPYFLEWLGEESDKEIFFINGKPLTNIKLNDLIKEITEKAKINRNVTSHDLRATMCYLMYLQGFPIHIIQRQMRHKKEWTTLSYLPIKNRLS